MEAMKFAELDVVELSKECLEQDRQWTVAPLSAPTQLVFIDPTVEDYQDLLQGAVPSTRIIVLEPNLDGVVQISNLLAEYSEITSLHLVCHGSSGSLWLGTAQLSLETLYQYQAQIQSWTKALANDACLVIYGCSVAAGDRGLAFIHGLRHLTGAEVAASTTPVGSSKLGGDRKSVV